MTAIELLAPAPSPEALDAAVGEGADAVYVAIKDPKAQARAAGFNYSQFETALRALHRTGRKLYVTLDTVFEQREADRIYQLLKYLAALGPDAIMVQDLGVVTMAREHFPSLKLHASTKLNAASAKGINMLSRNGFSRTVLARELSLQEIRDIRANTNMELEVFVHGALCVSVSGLCLFSSYLGGKSANRGICAQACRRFYTAFKGKGFEAGPSDGENGGYYFSLADLELIEKIPDLADAGVNAFRIEGPARSAEYVGTVVSAYRLVINSLESAHPAGSGGEKLKDAFKEAKAILKNDFARSKTTYLLDGIEFDGIEGAKNGKDQKDGASGIDWLNPNQDGGLGIALGTILKVKGHEEECRGYLREGIMSLAQGDTVRFHRADDSERVSHKLKFVEKGNDGGSWISIPEGFGPGDAVYLIQTKGKKRYTQIITREGSGRIPGRDKAPLPLAQGQSKETAAKQNKKRSRVNEDLPQGYYAMVSRVEDLYVLQSVRPAKAILSLSRKNSKQLLDSAALPFPPRDLILSLDPFFPQANEAELEDSVRALMENGYTRFIVNNLGHFPLFRRGDNEGKVTLIAGPWLYAFNAWSWDFITRCGAEYGVSPLENNRQNLERAFPYENYSRSKIFITIFSQPPLFHIPRDLHKVYDFEIFSDSREETFRFASGRASSQGGSAVHPTEAFSIVDKTPFLKEAGFSRFILDFSPGPLKKSVYKDIMDFAERSVPIPGASRFNWKNGFYHDPALK